MTAPEKKIRHMEAKTPLSCSVLLSIICTGVLLFEMTCPISVDADDPKPIAVIDGTLKVSVGETVYLDGSFSSDPGGNELSYRWTLEAAPSESIATISDSTDTEASFEADVAGTYRVKLVVNNGIVDSGPVYATIIVTE